jgi:lipoprotein-anchoring transpeptidase ErfK/SrfK
MLATALAQAEETPQPQPAAANPEPPAAAATAETGTPDPAAATPAPVAEAPPPPPPPPPITLVLKADLSAQRVSVVENGKVKFVWPISSGRPGFATKTGTFRAQWMSRMWYSRQYELAPMPHAVFFNRGTAFHGTSAVGLLGRPASHGCIRLAPGHAAKLFALVQKHSLVQTKVVVHGGPREPAVARRAPKGGREIARGRQREVGPGASVYQTSFGSRRIRRVSARSGAPYGGSIRPY